MTRPNDGYECLHISGRCSHAECGAWPYDIEPQPPQPTVEDYCAAGQHAYAGDDGAQEHGGRGRCYCGQREYPWGGPNDEEPSPMTAQETSDG